MRIISKNRPLINQSSFNSVDIMKNNKEKKNDEIQSLNLGKLKEKLTYIFDYEVNSIKLEKNDEMNCKISYYSPSKKTYRILNYEHFNDKLRPLPKIIPSKNPKKQKYDFSIWDKEFTEIEDIPTPKNKKEKKANFLKILVSKQKRRYRDQFFDLDMAYITNRVIAMGFPSVGCESIYRNSSTDIKKFFHQYHNDKVKIYNLCLEKNRIYNKNNFEKFMVGLFPATDHNPCPIKLILEFCVDICLYLIKNKDAVAAVHCKAGKGRTGVMICSYLVFSGLCENTEKALRYYARIRTKNNAGITIPSQKRYIRYFESFLKANFHPPYIYFIPKIIRYHFMHLYVENGRFIIKNMLQNFQKEKAYFLNTNDFVLKGVRIGPLKRGCMIKMKICNFVNNIFKLKENILIEVINKKKTKETYYQLNFIPDLIIHSDIKMTFKGTVNFYIWVNLWYASWEMIKLFYDEEIKKIYKLQSKTVKYDENYSDGTSHDKLIRTDDDRFFDKKGIKSLYEIIYKLRCQTDLNELVKKINYELDSKFDKRNMQMMLDSTELDKFKEAKKYPDLKVYLYYGLLKKQHEDIIKC